MRNFWMIIQLEQILHIYILHSIGTSHSTHHDSRKERTDEFEEEITNPRLTYMLVLDRPAPIECMHVVHASSP